MSPKDTCGHFSLYIVNLYFILNHTSSAFILTYICMSGSGSVFRVRIRIQEAPEYGSNTDPYLDRQHWYIQHVYSRLFCLLLSA